MTLARCNFEVVRALPFIDRSLLTWFQHHPSATLRSQSRPQRMKSAFEKLPREIRDQIYGYCLIHDGEIIPYPTVDEVKQIEESGGTPAKRSIIPKFDKAYKEYKEREPRSCAETKYATEWPSIALLGVSKGIREEAAVLLFGKNVWRLSFRQRRSNGVEQDFWLAHIKHFRHVTTHMSSNDGGKMVDIIKEQQLEGKAAGLSHRRIMKSIHNESIQDLILTFWWKHSLIKKMMPTLKSLVIDVENLYCPRGCCRDLLLHYLFLPWSQLAPYFTLKLDGSLTPVENDCLWINGESVGNRKEISAGGSEQVEEIESISPKAVDLALQVEHKVDLKVIGLSDDRERNHLRKSWGKAVFDLEFPGAF